MLQQNTTETIQPNKETSQDTSEMLHKIAQELYIKNLELHKERSRINEILAKIADAVFAIDQDFKITLFNAKAEEIFQKKAKDVIQKPADEIIKIYRGDSNNLIQANKYAFTKKFLIIDRINTQTESDTETKDKMYYKLQSTYVQFEESKKEAVVALLDITKEVELDKLKDEFISIASHELKTPITIVNNNLWMLNHMTKKKYTTREKRYIGEMQQGLSRLQSIINNLLNVSRLQQGRIIYDIKECDLYQLIQSSIDNFKSLVSEKGLKLHPPQKTEAKTQTDTSKFQEIFDNFLSNAIKYTQKGDIKIMLDKQNKYYKISIEDSGPGIAKKDYDKIFTKFGRAEAGLKLAKEGANSSTGLGLYISKQFAKGLGGDASFTSTLKKGSTFFFTIPISNQGSSLQTNTHSDNIKK